MGRRARRLAYDGDPPLGRRARVCARLAVRGRHNEAEASVVWNGKRRISHLLDRTGRTFDPPLAHHGARVTFLGEQSCFYVSNTLGVSASGEDQSDVAGDHQCHSLGRYEGSISLILMPCASDGWSAFEGRQAVGAASFGFWFFKGCGF
jgi:hypothetical protein